MKLALVQQHASEDLDNNQQRGLDALDRAAANGASMVCFAELAFEPFYPQRHATGPVTELAQPIPGPLTEVFAAKAKEHGVVVVLNLFERDGERTFDTSPVIDADGTLLGRTRMVHITDYEHFHESEYYHPGDRGAAVYDTAAGRIGIAICYDRHFPEYTRALALAGADLILVPQAGAVGEWPEGLFEAEMRVTAFQNGCFVGLCNRVGKEPNLEFAGESFVCDPFGQIISRAAPAVDEILYTDIDLALNQQTPARKLFMPDRRPELYSEWLATDLTSTQDQSKS